VQNFWSREWHELRKRGLVWLLLFSFVAVAFVMTDQARTVEQQRELIQVLQSDSMQLFSTRMQDLTDQHRKSLEAQKPGPGTPDAGTPKNAAPPKTAVPPATAAPKKVQPVLDRTRMLRSI
jgi:hypothetical protein